MDLIQIKSGERMAGLWHKKPGSAAFSAPYPGIDLIGAWLMPRTRSLEFYERLQRHRESPFTAIFALEIAGWPGIRLETEQDHVKRLLAVGCVGKTRRDTN